MSASAILKLQKVGFTSEQVEALADFMDTQAASKADLESTEHRLDVKITEVKSELRLVETGLRAELKQIEQRMTIKLGAMLLALAGLLLAAIRYLPPHP